MVAGALRREDGRWLMQRRPPGKAHAGLWEFPGGKLEPGETPPQALIRELHEEVSITIDPASCRPARFATSTGDTDDPGIVLLLYIIDDWGGHVRSNEGAELNWYSEAEMDGLAVPPLDRALIRQLFC
ncbi:MAG: (deoxy)nucleoside triphosphate pyrophosphohydrolase [Pontixanthobacter sp.]